MEAIVLAGGLGTRLRSVVKDVPKPMALVNGRPFLEYILDQLNSHKFNKVILAVGYKSEIITNHFGNNYKNMDIQYSIEASPLGTGGAIKKALDTCSTDHVYILNGDTYLNLNFTEIETLWQLKKKPIIVARHIENRSRYGALITKEYCGDTVVIDFKEKGTPTPGLINSGCYVCQRNIFSDFPRDNFSFESDYILPNAPHKLFLAYRYDGKFIDIGIPSDYEKVQTLLN